MPEEETRKSMIGAPPSSKRATRGGNTPASSTPSRTSARAAKKIKKEEDEDEYRDLDPSDPEKSEEEEESEESADEAATPSRKGAGGAKKPRKRAPLTDYHLKKKKILARKAQREAEKNLEKEKKKERGSPEVEEKPREPTPPPVRKPTNYNNFTALQLMMDHILRKLIEKDPEGYFLLPVSSIDAPGYHEIVKNPMDLRTVRENIEDGKYESMGELKSDCDLIVANAKLYNQPNTVYYLAASRLANLYNYYFGEQYLRYLFHTLPFANKIPLEKVGLAPLASLSGAKFINKRRSILSDNMTSKECLQNADEKVRARLSARKPKAKMVFLNEKDGTMMLNVLNEGGSNNDTNGEKKLTLADIVGPLEEGTPGLIQLGEHRLYSQSPMTYMNYGAFASFAPQYDSTWASMTKEDTDLFLRTYGDRSNTTDMASMRKYVENAGDHMIKVVDDLLDTLTDGEHSRAMKELNGENTKPDDADLEERVATEQFRDYGILSLIDDVSTLENIGIDAGNMHDIRQKSIVYEVQPQNVPEYMIGMEHMDVQQRLNNIGQAINDLAHVQQSRLNQPPPPTLINVPEPGMMEQKLAETIQQNIVHEVAQYTTPSDFVSEPVLHNAMGLDMDEDIMSEFFVTN